ncbi:MAG: DUF2147 domain-containing protein [Spirochaetia bacterium]|nr:DUF2147 domain-containing protein [Spirochaetia bacterium]
MLKKTNVRLIGLFVAVALNSLFVSSLSAQNTPVGKWKTIDDATGEVKSIVAIWDYQGKLYGRIEQLFVKPGEDADPKCDKCGGANKDKPVKGMTIIWDMSQDGAEWKGGYIMDPKNGSTYRCKLTPIEGGAKLNVSGFIGFSFAGRTQTWIRVQ